MIASTDYAHIELEPKPNRQLDAADGTPPIPPNTRDTVFGTTYADATTAFQAAVEQDARRRWRPTGEDLRHPQHTVTLGGEATAFVYDADLDQRLLEIYILFGWAGIRAVEAALQRTENSQYKVLYPWPAARRFFSITRNLLFAAVRDELAAFERAAAEQLIPRLNSARDAAAAAWAALGVRRATAADVDGNRVVVWASGRRRSAAMYTLSKTDLVTRTMAELAPLVAARQSLTALKRRRDELEATTPMAVPARLLDMQVERDALLPRIDALVEQVETGYRRLYEVCPIALLAVPQLRHPVQVQDFARAVIGATLDVIDEAERIGGALLADPSWVTRVLGDLRSATAVATVPDPERAVAEHALETVEDDARYLPMVTIPLLTELIGQTDGLGFVVRSQYVAVLMNVTAQRERTRKTVATILGLLAKVAALISLLTLLTPVGWVVKLAAIALDVGLVAYQVHAAVGQLAQFDRTVDEALIDLDRVEMDKLARLGELVGMRPEFIEQLTTSVVIEIGLIVAAGAWQAFRQLVHARGYYNDLETLLEP